MATVVSIGYKSGVPFDEEYYFGKHIPMGAQFFSKSGIRVEVIKQSSAGGRPPYYQIMARLYFDSPEAAQAALSAPEAAPLLADIKNFYHGEPDIVFGEVVASV